jgi:deoxyribodipyrimidine photo-lyase
MSHVPQSRVLLLDDRPVRRDGDHVLYWMVTNRRLEWNFALEQAAGYARELGKPLLVLEALRHDYRWASPRMHRFCLDGMLEHRERLAGTRVAYHPYVEPEPGAGRGLLEALAADACVVVTDDYPVFFIPRMQRAAAQKLDVRLETVDSNGLYPMRDAGRDFTMAVHFRRHLHKKLALHLVDFPAEHPLRGDPLEQGEIPENVLRSWPPADEALLEGDPEALEALGLADQVPPVSFGGGRRAGVRRLERFLDRRLGRYHEDRNDPDDEAASRLSPYLHWGHISAHEVFHRLAEREGWSPARLSGEVTAKREGWWGMSPPAEAFLDELVTWRELGFNFAVENEDYDAYETLPGWAQESLGEHADDPREHLYTLEEMDEAATHDEIWNAAQRELVRDGSIQNYLRMLWGKRILEWTEHPKQALEIMIELNNRYAVDGRDPNSYSGIFWVLGRFDRGWKERPIYGKVRYMSSDATRRKLSLDNYLEAFGEGTARWADTPWLRHIGAPDGGASAPASSATADRRRVE